MLAAEPPWHLPGPLTSDKSKPNKKKGKPKPAAKETRTGRKRARKGGSYVYEVIVDGKARWPVYRRPKFLYYSKN